MTLKLQQLIFLANQIILLFLRSTLIRPIYTFMIYIYFHSRLFPELGTHSSYESRCCRAMIDTVPFHKKEYRKHRLGNKIWGKLHIPHLKHKKEYQTLENGTMIYINDLSNNHKVKLFCKSFLNQFLVVKLLSN